MIGHYTERVSVQERTLTNNGGTPVESYETADLYRVAASVQTAGGVIERVFGSQMQGEASHVVTMPAPQVDVALSSRVVWHSRHGDRTLAIVGKVLTQDARKRELVLACLEPRTA